MKKGREFLSSLFRNRQEPVSEASLFGDFENLTYENVEHILQVIKEDLEVSMSFGLELEPGEILREKITILALFDSRALDLIGHGEELHSQNSYQIVSSFLVESANEMLADISLKYYNLDLEEDAQSKNPRAVSKFNLHLHSVVAKLHQYFYNIGISNVANSAGEDDS